MIFSICVWFISFFIDGMLHFMFHLFSKREVNKKVLKVPGVEQKVMDALSFFSLFLLIRNSSAAEI